MAILTTKPSPNGKFLIPNILASKGHRGNSIHLKNRPPDCESQFIGSISTSRKVCVCPCGSVAN